MRYEFVKSTLKQLVNDGVLDSRDSIIAVAAREDERKLFEDIEFPSVTISNLDERMTGTEYAPFDWSFQDAQQLTLEDRSFDFAFVSDGLHHCDSPHRAMLEMYRVARKGIIVFESRDSFLMRLANRLNLSPKYELEAVVRNEFSYGGVNNTCVPNYIYRWTEKEFTKAIRSYDPTGKHDFRFFYGLNLPYEMAEMKKSRLKYNVVCIASPFARLAGCLFKKQCNSFCMVALKPANLWPWLELKEGEMSMNVDYAQEIFR